MRHLIHVLVSVIGLASLAACGDENECEGACECSGLECACPDSGDCFIDCIADCTLDCTGSGNCEFECGAGCDVACTGSGDCLVFVGDDSSVDCPGSGGCDVICGGDCAVDCPGSGVCQVDCEPGFICDLTSCETVMSCPDDIAVCNGGCPS